MAVITDQLDWGGTSMITYNSAGTDLDGFHTTQPGTTDIASWTTAESSDYSSAFAQLVLNQLELTSNSAPGWFTTLEPEIKSFALQAFMPEYLKPSMPLDLTVPEMPPTLPEIPRSLTPGVAVAEMKPKIDHDAKPATYGAESSEHTEKVAAELAEEPRPASAMSIRQVQQEDVETPKKSRKSWRLSRG
ncbi:hypothetical protein B0A48_12445 [Cryoendolithus antarcticus]|uniref:Uncharacterized protein n=1 Tax=Cryoendolithus antarcticus TaxID=1507870 RepID=A0A1V8SSU5_9PEZI|nr:hypothetical protein B0A48_12445 [Cryoendolithus antarcticus]